MNADEIEEDKQRWFQANQLLEYKTRPQIKVWLADLEGDEYRQDMKRRLNEMVKNRKEKKWQSG